jgi:hypothetical protein
MLTINNVTKVYKRDVGEWRIGKVLVTKWAYKFVLYNPNGKNLEIYLMRHKDSITNEYDIMYNKDNKKVSLSVNISNIQSPDFMTYTIARLIKVI